MKAIKVVWVSPWSPLLFTRPLARSLPWHPSSLEEPPLSNFLPHPPVPSGPQPLNEFSKQTAPWHCTWELGPRVGGPGPPEGKDRHGAPAVLPSAHTCGAHLSVLNLYPDAWHAALGQVLLSWRSLPASGRIYHLTCVPTEDC